MNREVIKRYKKEFEWWLNGGSIMCKKSNGDWIKTSNIGWNDNREEISYLINDEYADLRIAEAEGKKIQVFIMNQWGDTSRQCFDFGRYPLNMWRVKPETVIKWQWIFKNVCGTFSMTTSPYSSKEDMSDSLKSKAIEPYLPSAKEFEA